MLTRFQKKLLSTLEDLYPVFRSELNFENEFQLAVSVILSAQCTDKKVNEITPSLFAAYPDFIKLAAAKLTEIEKIIRPINYYKSKSRNLIKLGQMIESEHAGQLPKTMEALVSLPGIGRKTASVVLGELGVIPTLPVDTHVMRLSNRLGMSAGKNATEVEADLRKLFPSEHWRELHHRLIYHGRRVCKARNPDCAGCSLFKICPGRQQEKSD